MGALGGFGVFLMVLALIVAVLWIFLPFAVFGIKDLAKTIIRGQQRTNDLLAQLSEKTKSEIPPAVERKDWT